MPGNTPFWDLIALKLVMFLPKITIAVIGAVFGLILVKTEKYRSVWQ